MNSTENAEILAGIDAAVEAGEMTTYTLRALDSNGEFLGLVANERGALVTDSLADCLITMGHRNIGWTRTSRYPTNGRTNWARRPIVGWVLFTERAGVRTTRHFESGGIELDL